MQMKIACCLMVLLVLLTGIGLAESKNEAVPDIIQRDYDLKDFTIAIDSAWQEDTVEDADEKTLLSLTTIDRQEFFTINLIEEGGDERAVEIAAINDYEAGVHRTSAEKLNGIYMTFAAMDDPKAAYAYFSINDNVYTASLKSMEEEYPLEKLQQELYDMLKTITLNIAE